MSLVLNGTNGITLPATTTVQNCAIGAFVTFNGLSGASPVIKASFNVTSVTRTATGQYTIVMTNALSDVNYSVVATSSFDGTNNGFLTFQNRNGTTKSTTTFYIQTSISTTGTATDSAEVGVIAVR